MRKQDPLALAVFGAALALLAGLLLYVFLARPEASSGPRLSFLEPLRRELQDMVEAVRRDLPGGSPAAEGMPADRLRVPLPAGKAWRYAVTVRPEAWREVTLTYRTRQEGGALLVDTEFVHATGRSAFRLGTFAPGNPSHQNTRFPGFFFHAAYLPEEVKKGQAVSWGWPWQGGAGRTKRWEARVAGWEQLRVPAGMYRALRLEADLLYLEGGKVKARARETLWYAPEVAQVVKVVREGATPDEGLQHITAELAEFR